MLRGRKVVSRSNDIAAVGGVVEVNHGGAPGCWTVNTPDIHAGDVVRIVGPDGVAEQTTTADVSSGRPVQTAAGTVVIHGTANDGSDGQSAVSAGAAARVDRGELRQERAQLAAHAGGPARCPTTPRDLK